MLKSVLIPTSSSSSVFFDGCHDFDFPRSFSRVTSTTMCCSSRSHAYIPKLEPFSRSKIDRGVKEPSLIQKSENEIADYCSTLEGDASYNCWRAYFELKDLERELPKEDIEKVVLQSGGVKSLIDCLHGIWSIQKMKKEKDMEESSLKSSSNSKKEKERPFPIPDGLPKSKEELEEEEKARMPDSPFTRLLRTKGKFPAWFSPVPDHETD